MDRKKRKCPSKACFCALLTAWMATASIVFLVCCSLYIQPLIRILKFKFVSCRVENSFFTTQFICSCGSECKSIYPCTLIHVSFNVSNGETWTVSLYNDDHQQLSVVSLDPDAKEWCSLKVCHKEALENHRIVTEFFQQYGQRGTVIQCAYDPWDVKAGAVLHVSKLTMDVFHALFWPFVGLLTGVLLCIIFCQRCQKQHVKKEDNENEASVELTKVEEGKGQIKPNIATATNNKDSESAGKASKQAWGRFKKNKTASKSTNSKKATAKTKAKQKGSKR